MARWDDLLDLIYPRACAGCGAKPDRGALHLCWDCLAALPIVKAPYCSLCGDPVEGRVDESFVCWLCAGNKPHFDLARSAGRYRGTLQEMLRQFKYGDALWLEKDLSELLATCVATHYDLEQIDAVTFVPLYPARRRDRGYNQAEILASALARGLGKPLLGRALARIRPTPSQTNLTAKERADNVRAAFKASGGARLNGQSLLLIDDVMTTGATVSECARALKEGGARRVWVATVARG